MSIFNLSPLELFGALIVAHMLCDYPLQGDFLAKAKNHTAPIPGVPWQQALVAHSIIHGGAVWLLTGIWWLGVAETVAHALIDHLKCSNRPGFGFTGDQSAHIVCKGLWIALAFIGTYGPIPVVALMCGLATLFAIVIATKPVEVRA